MKPGTLMRLAVLKPAGSRIGKSWHTLGEEIMKSSAIHIFAVVGTVIGLTMSVRPAAADPPKIITIDAPGAGTSAFQGTQAFVINLGGAIAGDYIDAGGVYHGFLLGVGDHFTTFEAPGAGTKAGQGTAAISINQEGATAGCT